MPRSLEKGIRALLRHSKQVFLSTIYRVIIMDESPKESTDALAAGPFYFFLIPWVYASFCSLLSVSLLLVIDRFFPHLFSSLLGIESVSYHGIFPFGMRNPLGDISLVFLTCAFGIHFASGLSISFVRFKKRKRVRFGGAGACLFISVAILFSLIPVIGVLWSLAWKFGAVPLAVGGDSAFGNHGPWRHFYDLRAVLQVIYLIPLCSMGFALLSAVFKITRWVFIILISDIAVLYVLFLTLYWLID